MCDRCGRPFEVGDKVLCVSKSGRIWSARNYQLIEIGDALTVLEVYDRGTRKTLSFEETNALSARYPLYLMEDFVHAGQSSVATNKTDDAWNRAFKGM